MKDVFSAAVKDCDHEAVRILAKFIQLLLHVVFEVYRVIQSRLGPILLEPVAREIIEKAALLPQFCTFKEPLLYFINRYLKVQQVGVYERDDFAFTFFSPKLLYEALDYDDSLIRER